MNYYVAIDIGASSGRHIVGWLEDGKLKTEEVYRFKNGMESKGCLIYTSPSPRDSRASRMPSSA